MEENEHRQEGARQVSLLAKACKSEIPTKRGRRYYQAEFWPTITRGKRTPSSCVWSDISIAGRNRIDCPARADNFFSKAPGFRHLLPGALLTWPSSGAWPQFAPAHIPNWARKNAIPALGKSRALRKAGASHNGEVVLVGGIRSTITFIPITSVPRSKS